MRAKDFLDEIQSFGVNFFTGVPDSLLTPFLNEILKTEVNHIVAPNEGIAVSLAAGHYLSAGNVGCVYLQNSGLGNIFNPVCSLTHKKVYGIPALYVVGWRGEPGVKDEPQHLFQGKITLETLKLLEIKSFSLDRDTKKEDLHARLTEGFSELAAGNSVALVIRKGFWDKEEPCSVQNTFEVGREEAIECITEQLSRCVFFSTTGKISRELYEIRERREQLHSLDFLTIGSMGHCSSIALAAAQGQPKKQICCLDGDGAALMHMGAMGLIGAQKPDNLIHIVLDNEMHETVGGVPTISGSIDFGSVAKACGYSHVYYGESLSELNQILAEIKTAAAGLTFVHFKVKKSTRTDLGRPKESPKENMNQFVEQLRRKI